MRKRRTIIRFWWLEHWIWLSSRILIHFNFGSFFQLFVRSLLCYLIVTTAKNFSPKKNNIFFKQLFFSRNFQYSRIFSSSCILKRKKYGPIRCLIVILKWKMKCLAWEKLEQRGWKCQKREKNNSTGRQLNQENKKG